MALPMVAVMGFAGLTVAATNAQATRAEELRRLVATGAAAGDLAHRLQLERAATAVRLAGAAEPTEELDEATAATDQAAQRYARARQALTGPPGGSAALLDRVDDKLSSLDGLRDEVASGEVWGTGVELRYRNVIADLIAFRGSVAQTGGAPAEVADHLLAAGALSQATDRKSVV